MDYILGGLWTIGYALGDGHPSSTILRCHSPRAYLPVAEAPFYAYLLLKYGFVVTLWMQRLSSPSQLTTRTRPRMFFLMLLVPGVSQPTLFRLFCHCVPSDRNTCPTLKMFLRQIKLLRSGNGTARWFGPAPWEPYHLYHLMFLRC